MENIIMRHFNEDLVLGKKCYNYAICNSKDIILDVTFQMKK